MDDFRAKIKEIDQTVAVELVNSLDDLLQSEGLTQNEKVALQEIKSLANQVKIKLENFFLTSSESLS